MRLIPQPYNIELTGGTTQLREITKRENASGFGEEEYVEGALAFNADEEGTVTGVEQVAFAEAQPDDDAAAEEQEEAPGEDAAPEEVPAQEEAPVLNLRHKTDPAAMGDGGASSEEEAASAGAKVGRNDPCPCGSGKKYKKCCGR